MSCSRVLRTVAILLLTGTLPLLAGQNQVRTINRQGNQLFSDEQWAEALAEYTAANELDPQSPVLHYNLGNALHRLNDLDKAETHYRMAAAAEDTELSSHARFNLGNTAYRRAETLEGAGDWQGRNQALGQALDHWKTVLEAEPDNTDAKRNLELGLRKLQEQPPDEQQQDQEQEDQEQEDQEQEDQEQEDQEQEEQEQEGQEQEQQGEGEDQEQQGQPQEEEQDDQQEEQPQQQAGEEEEKDEQQEQQADQQPGEEQEQEQEQQDGQQEEARISEEEAQRILDALRDEEVEEQRRQLAERKGRGGSAERDW